MPFTGARRRTNSQGRLRGKAHEERATASVEFGGFRAFRAGVKVAHRLGCEMAQARGESGVTARSGSAASPHHAANVDADVRASMGQFDGILCGCGKKKGAQLK